MEEILAKAALKEWVPQSGVTLVPAYESKDGSISEYLVQLSFKDSSDAMAFCEKMEALHAISS